MTDRSAELEDIVDATPEYIPDDTTSEGAVRLPPRRLLGELKVPVEGEDPSELIRHRFICKGGVSTLIAPTGIGKSTFVIQGAMSWSLGWPFFGLKPVKPVRAVLVQAENDEGDLAEMRAGIEHGLCLGPDQTKMVGEAVATYTDSTRTGDDFGAMARAICAVEDEFDLLIVDPAFAYIGGDTAKATDVTHFLRHILIPLAQQYNVAVLVVHHTNKPPSGREKPNWSGSDYAYLGAGSAEWVNASRAALAIRNIGSERIFELRAVKRGARLRWSDSEGERTLRRYIAHHRDQEIICWREPEPEEVEEVLADSQSGNTGKKKLVQPDTVEHVFREAGRSLRHEEACDLIGKRTGCGRSTAATALSQAVKNGVIFKGGGYYALPQNCPS